MTLPPEMQIGGRLGKRLRDTEGTGEPDWPPLSCALLASSATEDREPLSTWLMAWASTGLSLPDSMAATLRELRSLAEWEVFEDGTVSRFSRIATRLVQQYGEPAVEAISEWATDHDQPLELRCESIRVLSSLEASCAHRLRRLTLSVCLRDRDARIRDTALVAVEEFNDASLATDLRSASAAETVAAIRQDMAALASEFESRADAVRASHDK